MSMCEQMLHGSISTSEIFSTSLFRRQTVTGALRSTLSRQTSSSIDTAMKRAFSAERALASSRLAPEVREALRTGHKMDTAYNNGAAGPLTNGEEPIRWDSLQRRKTPDKVAFRRPEPVNFRACV